MTIDYNNLSKLVCNRGGIWQLTTSTCLDLVIASSGYYISNTTGSGINVVRTNNLSQAARFSLDSNGYVVVVNNPNGIMYLAGNSTSNLRFISSYGVSDYHYFTYANDTLTCSRSGYFVRYTSSWFSGTWSYGTDTSGRVNNYSNGSLAAI